MVWRPGEINLQRRRRSSFFSYFTYKQNIRNICGIDCCLANQPARRRRELICEFARTLPLITTCKSLLYERWSAALGMALVMDNLESLVPAVYHCIIHSPAGCLPRPPPDQPSSAAAQTSAVCATKGRRREEETETRTSLFGHYLFWSSFATMSKMLSFEKTTEAGLGWLVGLDRPSRQWARPATDDDDDEDAEGARDGVFGCGSMNAKLGGCEYPFLCLITSLTDNPHNHSLDQIL